MREASCRCGAVTATCQGEPIRISVCHCLSCQLRSGSAFAAQARFPADAVAVNGDTRTYTATSDSGALADFRFCLLCGATIAYVARSVPDQVAIPLGAFADPHAFGPPTYQVYEDRKFDWVTVDAPVLGPD
ncbi:GFA family protein [Sphingomonas sp. ST-64]|uniref:GFA family protein n=1 Tax=Sphingomonas plantiphila TaxID=3163295 RepID=A0ABW8YQX9_9SPHN